MIVLSNTLAQTLAVGESITFDRVILHTGCGECHRANSQSVKMRAHGIYEIHFSGNISGTAANPVQLSILVGGEPLPETTMIVTPAAAGDQFNVATATAVKNCCGDYDRVTITNTGTAPVLVETDTLLFVKRVS